MTEQTNPQAEQTPPETPPAPTQSLEELYAEYNVGTEQPAPPPQADPVQPEPQPAADSDTAIRAEMAQLRQELSSYRAEKADAADRADLKKAVAFLGKEAEIEGKEPILQGYLVSKASEDARLRMIWEQRGQNPKAWKRALEILADEVRDEFAVPNPQLEENQRAMDESQRAQTSTAPAPAKPEQKVMGMNDADFSNFWQRLAGRSY